MFAARTITTDLENEMINQETIRKLNQMRLSGMAQAFEDQLSSGQVSQISFEERFGLIVDSEFTHRDSRRINRYLKEANMRERAACIEDIDFKAGRGMERGTVASLALCDWIRNGINLIITGPTGTGKTWLACAIGNHACRKLLSAKFHRLPLLLDELSLSHADGSFRKKLNQLGKFDLLILDDLGVGTLNPVKRNDLLEVIEQRSGIKSTIITSQLPTIHWHDYLGDGNPTVADAILDRLQGGSQRLELKGESLRKTRPKKLKA